MQNFRHKYNTPRGITDMNIVSPVFIVSGAFILHKRISYKRLQFSFPN